MASSSGGASAPLLPVMPDFSTPSLSHSTAGELKYHLQALLDSKERQLQSTATLGQRVLAQQMELEERVRHLQETTLDKGEEEDVDAETRQRFRELGDTIKAWDTQNAQLFTAFGGSVRLGANTSSTPHSSSRHHDTPREESERLKSSTSAAQSRRAKNAAHRADDVEFAFEIGSGLLTEVRRLQSLLAERDKVIQDMKEEKDDLEKSIASLRTALRQQEQSADKYKEENWNLEVTLQELRSQLSSSLANSQRLEAEHKRLNKLLASTRDAGEQQKNDLERLQTTMEELKVKHETDIAQARKLTAGLQRDKSDLQQSIEALKAEHARSARRLPRFGSPLTPNGSYGDYLTPGGADEDDVFSATASTTRRKGDHSMLIADNMSDYADSSPDVSPAKPFLAPNHPSNEVEALQQRLAHAQRQINTLKNTLQREKELKMDYRRQLESSPGVHVADQAEDDDEVDEEVVLEISAKPKARSTPFRSGGSRIRGGRRGRGGLSLVQRLAASSPASEYNDEAPFESSPPPVSPIPLDFEQEGDEEASHSVEDQEPPSPSPFDAPSSNRASMDGLDPSVSSLLKRASSVSSIRHVSPLRHAAVTRGGAIGRRRGGAAYQEARPASLIGQPEALAFELGIGGSSMRDSLIYEEVSRQTAEFACQTDDLTPPPPIHIIPASSEMGVQVQPPPEPVVASLDIACQTESTVIQTTEIGIQHESLEPKPILLSASIATDPEPSQPKLVDAEVQSLGQATQSVDIQTSPARLREGAESPTTPQPRFATPRRRNLSLRTDQTVTPTKRNFVLDISDDEGEQTETPADSETETDLDDYEDARQSIVGSTPAASTDDFHSIDGTDLDDDSSVKASRLPSRQGYLTAPSTISSYASLADVIPEDIKPISKSLDQSAMVSQEIQATEPESTTYDTKSIMAIPTPEPSPKPSPQPLPQPSPKTEAKSLVELKECSIQTDDWKPSPPIVAAPIPQTASPTPPSGFGLYRGPPLQFVSTPPPASRSATPLLPSAPLNPSGFRDATHIRRQSQDSIRSSIMEELLTRPSSSLGVDKTRPPVMMLPPPPRMPPPPTNMPPPSFIPERRIHISSSSQDMPPPRPSSPPPAELIQRATTPIGSILNVPGRNILRQHGSNVPSSQQGMKQPASTGSINASANSASSLAAPLHLSLKERRERSNASLTSERSVASPRSSVSSERAPFLNRPQTQPNLPVTPSRSVTVSTPASPPKMSTDPEVIHAITQTMIGEFLYKYTRRTIGKGHGTTRHKRFFWVHPYTKTLYWSDADPSSSKVSESSAKSSYIEGVRSVLDPNPMPPGLYQYSVVVSTPQREMKITAPTKERHDIWLNALRYLITRSGGVPGTLPQSPRSGSSLTDDEQQRTLFTSPQSQRSARSRTSEWNTSTPRGQRSRSQMSTRGSVGRRAGTPAAEYLRWNAPDSPYSPSKSFEHVQGQHHDDEDDEDEDLDFALHSDRLSDEGYEGLENVRTCCNGRHTVGNHHHHHDLPGDPPLPPDPAARPVSPAWSFRSRSGSTNSREATSLFSWGKADGKMRFGSRRSKQTVIPQDN